MELSAIVPIQNPGRPPASLTGMRPVSQVVPTTTTSRVLLLATVWFLAAGVSATQGYNFTYGATQCYACQPGTISSSDGSDSCSACNPGYYQVCSFCWRVKTEAIVGFSTIPLSIKVECCIPDDTRPNTCAFLRCDTHSALVCESLSILAIFEV